MGALGSDGERPDGIFCGNDQIAGVADALRERGVDVPRNASVVGFDNWELVAELTRPALTTVHKTPWSARGSHAASAAATGLSRDSTIYNPARMAWVEQGGVLAIAYASRRSDNSSYPGIRAPP